MARMYWGLLGHVTQRVVIVCRRRFSSLRAEISNATCLIIQGECTFTTKLNLYVVYHLGVLDCWKSPEWMTAMFEVGEKFYISNILSHSYQGKYCDRGRRELSNNCYMFRNCWLLCANNFGTQNVSNADKIYNHEQGSLQDTNP